MTRPTDNLVRCAPVELRAKGSDGGSTMVGHFAVFDQWTEIHSWYEGNFLERIAPGAFADVFARGDHVKVLVDHGAHPSLGNTPIGRVTSLTEDAEGAAYEVDLFRKALDIQAPLVVAGLDAGEYGASFRFRVAAERNEQPTKPTAHNPLMLEERTITKVEPLYEFGPVTFPAYAGASAGLRSGTDQFFERLLNDPHFLAAIAERTDGHVVKKMLEQAKTGDAPGRSKPEAGDVPDGLHPSIAEARLRIMRARAA